MLDIAALLTLVAALALFLPVLERVIAATWQHVKFLDYSNDGRISLSLGTGIVFTSLSAVVFGFALWFNAIAKRRPSLNAQRLLFLAMSTVVLSVLIYWLLGLSHFNIWRP